MAGRLIEWLTREKDTAVPADATSGIGALDDRLLRSPSVAVQESFNYTTQMCSTAHDTLRMAFGLLSHYSEERARDVVEHEDIIDLYEDRLGTFLVRLSSRELSSRDSHAVSLMLHSIGDFERLGDHAVNIQKVAEEIWEKKLSFSEEANQEITVLLAAIEEILQLTEDAFTKADLTVARQVEPLEQVVDKLISKIKDHHIERLQRGECTIEMGFILSDLLNNCERVSDHCSNIAVALIEVEHNSFDTHKYLNDVKYGSADFAAAYETFAGKYAL